MDTPLPNPNDNNGPLIIRFGVVCMCISGIAVVLRFISRLLIKMPYLWDDWAVVAALPFAWAVPIIEIRGATIGAYGKHIEYVNPEAITPFFQLLYSLQIAYLFSIFFTKLSLLLFYRRVFSIPETKWPAYVIAGILVAWLIATLPPAIWSCDPLYGFWERQLEPTCINNVQYYIGITVPNIITDLALIIFPIPLIWKLHIRMSQKIPLFIIFTLAGFITVVSVVRMAVVASANNNPDVTWALVPLGVWTAVETNVGILLACLPSLLPILRFVLGQKLRTEAVQSSERTLASGTKRRWPSAWNPTKNDTAFSRLTDSQTGRVPGSKAESSVQIYKTTSEDHTELQETEAPQGIHVKRDIEWTQDDL